MVKISPVLKLLSAQLFCVRVLVVRRHGVIAIDTSSPHSKVWRTNALAETAVTTSAYICAIHLLSRSYSSESRDILT